MKHLKKEFMVSATQSKAKYPSKSKIRGNQGVEDSS